MCLLLEILALQDGVALDEEVLIGSRNPSRTAVDTPVPIDVIDISVLTLNYSNCLFILKVVTGEGSGYEATLSLYNHILNLVTK